MTAPKPANPEVKQHLNSGESGPDDLDLPHERDQRGDIATAPDPSMQQAKKDLDEGQVDTDLWGTAGLDHERREQLVPDVRGEPGKQEPSADGAPSTPTGKPAGGKGD